MHKKSLPACLLACTLPKELRKAKKVPVAENFRQKLAEAVVMLTADPGPVMKD
jgi:hypothetical protein